LTESELWFQRYAAEHGLHGADDHEPDLGKSARPDFRVNAGGPGVICEVKEFVTSSFQRRLADASFVTLSSHDQHGTVRNKIGKTAKRQLRPYAGRDDALVVVLANPRQVEVDIYEPSGVIAAMYGDPGYTFEVDSSTGEGGDGRWACLDGGVFGGGHHTYVSAVVVLHRGTYAADAQRRWMDGQRYRWTDIEDRQARMAVIWEICQESGFEDAGQAPGDYYFTTTYSTLAAATGGAVPLPEGVFEGPRDAKWAVNGTTGVIELVKPAIDC
jgi:hypothetical protein